MRLLLVVLLAVAAFAGLAGAAIPAETACNVAGAAITRHAICANPAARAADARMSTAFDAVLAQLSPTDAAVFRSNQQAWLDDRDTDCDSADDSGTAAKPAAIARCVTHESDERYGFLAGLPDEGPGPGSNIVPVMRQGQNGFIWSFHFADPKTPGEKLVNAKIDGEVASLHIGNGEGEYSDSFDAELKYASPTFLSASVQGDRLSPGGTDNKDFAYNLNVDMQAGRLLAFDDAFAPAILPMLQAMCAKERKDYLTIPGETAAEAAAAKADLYAKVADLDQWSFGANAAEVNLDPGDEDPYICHFGYGYLRKVVRPGFPLPK